MSTKIYCAWEWKAGLPKLIETLRYIHNEYFDFCVRHFLSTKTLPFDTGGLAMKEARKSIVEACLEGYRLEPLNFTAGAVVYFHGKRIFVQLFGLDDINNSGFTKWKIIKKHAVDYHYQNQIDRPKQITAREWNNRAKVWKSIFNSTYTPAMAGLTFSFFDPIWDRQGLVFEAFSQARARM
jgi:hypothetical protein